MPDAVTHTQLAAPLLGGAISALVARFFDIEPDVLLIAFIGAWIGVALRDSAPVFNSKLQAAFHFLKTLGIVIAGTLAAAWSVPIILYYWPDIAIKSLAAISGFVLVYFYVQIIELLGFGFTIAHGIIARLGGKVGE